MVLAPVSPHLLTLPMHLAVLEITDVGHFMLSEVVLTLTVELILHEAAFEITTVLPRKVTFALFLVLNEVSLKSAKCCFPRLSTMPIKFIVFPFALVPVALVWVLVNSVPVGSVVLPLAV